MATVHIVTFLDEGIEWLDGVYADPDDADSAVRRRHDTGFTTAQRLDAALVPSSTASTANSTEVVRPQEIPALCTHAPQGAHGMLASPRPRST